MAYALKNAIEHKGEVRANIVINSLFNEGLKKEKIKDIIKEIEEVIDEIKGMDNDEIRKRYEELKGLIGKRDVREGLRELENVKGKVVMRFSPSPSGGLHLGHAITASLSYLYVKKYGGIFYVRIEDTNPDKIYKPAYKMIEEESKWLFEKKAKIIIQSERMNVYYKYIDKLVKKKVVYVCTCSQEKFKSFVIEKKTCPCRNLQLKEQIERWGKMLDKTEKGYKSGDAVLRFKSDLNHKNPAFRDFPLARINTNPHVIQKKKYKVWPLMNLAVSIDDIEMKMTHVIRGKDHRDNSEKQKMIFKALGKRYPTSYFLGRIHIKGMELSSSKMREDIESGKYKGWDDEKLLTVSSLKKQKYKPIAIHKLSEQIGLNEVDKTIDKKEVMLLLDTFNKAK